MLFLFNETQNFNAKKDSKSYAAYWSFFLVSCFTTVGSERLTRYAQSDDRFHTELYKKRKSRVKQNRFNSIFMDY